MTKYFKLLLVAIIATMSFALTSCGDDNEPNNPDESEKVDDYDEPDDEPMPEKVENLEKKIIGNWTRDYYGVLNYTFYSNGTITVTDPEGDDSYTYDGKWWCSENILYIDEGDGKKAYYPVKISKDQIKFKIYYDSDDGDIDGAQGKDENGYYDILTFNRIK